MILVRLFDGPFDRDAIIHDTRMAVVPRVGETITIRWSRQIEETRYEVLAVDYLLDPSEGPEVKDDLTGARIQVRSL